MAAIKSIKVGETTYDLKATYDGAGNVIDTTYAKANAIPTKTSQLQNDSGYLTEHQDISELATKGELEGKVDKELGKGLSEANYTETEKEKLSTIANNANNYVHPTTSGNKHIPSGGVSGQMLVFSADGTAEWADSSSKLEEQFTALNEAWEELVLDAENGDLEKITADVTVLASGGVGGLYKNSTNFKHLTGDALAISLKHDIELKDMSYVQIHPTTLYQENPKERLFLISESVRGEGALLYDKNMNRFVDELQPRDVVAQAILKQMEKDGTDHVWEDLRTISKKELEEHFPNILAHCREAGYDPFTECIPVVPAQHYFMGGIKVNHHSKTTMDALYAVGETACNGVHGQNRLASNSLLESLVFAKRAAKDLVAHYETVAKLPESLSELDLEDYQDQESLEEDYKKMVLEKLTEQNQLASCIVQSELRKERIMMLDPITLKLNVDPLILSALSEDINNEDVSTNSVMPENVAGQVDLICKEDGIICGLPVFERVFYLLDPTTTFDVWVKDGEAVKAGQHLGTVHGDIRVLLSGERTALNYLQRMSGIATYTHEMAELLKDSPITLLDSRKTTPNNRIFEKYAVKVGGGKNHRYNLSDGVLLKDNHILSLIHI